jgi:plastocyanin
MISRTIRGLVAALGLALSAGMAQGSVAADAPEVSQVLIKDFMFSPMEVRIRAGTSVTWVNQDDEPHTVVGDAGLFRSGALDTAMAFTFRFDKPGTYQVFCSIHPQMKATVIVE